MNLPLADRIDFATPVALLALLAAPLVAGAALMLARQRRRARALLGEAQFARVGGSRVLRAAGATLLVAAVVLAAFGAARPRWGAGPADLAQRGIDVMIVLDVSRSMQAEDVPPSRAAAAATALDQMLEHLVGNRVGLVTFAGTALERSPLTLDTQAVAALVQEAQGEASLVRPGTGLSGAIETALNGLSVDDAASSQAIVLVSDGEDLGGSVDSALVRARDKHVRIYTVFAATPDPTSLPAESGGTDVTRADPTILARIAAETDGQLRELSTVPGLAVEFRRMAQTQFERAASTDRIERYQWFIGAAIALLAVESLLPALARRSRALRLRGTAAAAATGLLLVACSGTAAYRHVEAGNRAYRAGDFEAALAAYQAAASETPDDPAVNYDIGNALHQLVRYEEATVASSAAAEATDDPALSEKIQYSLGNHAFQRGEFSEARDHYIAALRIDPTDRDAKANLELALAALAPPSSGPAPTPQGGDQGDSGNNQGGQQQGDQPGDNGQTPTDGGTAPGDSGGAPGQPGTGAGDVVTPAETLDQATLALQSALGALGPEITRDEALRILQLAARANELQPLPSRSGNGVPPR